MNFIYFENHPPSTHQICETCIARYASQGLWQSTNQSLELCRSSQEEQHWGLWNWFISFWFPIWLLRL